MAPKKKTYEMLGILTLLKMLLTISLFHINATVSNRRTTDMRGKLISHSNWLFGSNTT
jgi:hypothetical protein